MTRVRLGWLAAACAALVLADAAAPLAQSCDDCVKTRFWQVSPTFWTDGSGAAPPELEALKTLKPADVGIAFSGGGTRSASATIGQLRGLRANGWLSRVRYMTAVSGGSWAAVPYAYYPGSLDDLLGVPAPLDFATVETVPAGLLADRVVRSKLAHVGLQEAPSFVPADSDRRIADRVDVSTLRSALVIGRQAVRKLRRSELPEPERQNKTYAHMLGQLFLDRLVPDGNRRPYTWSRDSAIEISAATGQPAGQFLVMPDDRPFLIVGGTAVKAVGSEYPRLIPVEYTPLYTGIRQRFGTVGGTYVWPWAYDRLAAAKSSSTEILVSPKPVDRMFTLADVIGSSGAAPQLELMLGSSVPAQLRPALRQAAAAFPSFSNLAVRGEGVEEAPAAPSAEIAHGDGGFSDNLGIMPLLARGVQNLLVFVNSSSTYVENDQLQSYFMRLAIRDGNGDKTFNAVFERERYREVLAGFDAAVRDGNGALYCGTNWTVLSNEIYNIRGYPRLNICFVYNHAAEKWKAALPPTIRDWVTPPDPRKLSKQAKALQRFPYYKTFGENRTSVIQLTPLQVNMLADLAAWSVTSDQAVKTIVSAFGEAVLPAPTPAVRP